MAREIIEHFKSLGARVWVLTHRLNLVKQLGDELHESRINFSYILPGFPQLNCKVLVGSIQTVIRRKDRMPNPDIIIIDEFHHVRSKAYMDLLREYNALVLGFTATPQRLDGKPLRAICDKLIIGPSMRELINSRYLCDYDYFAPMTIDMSDVKHIAGEFAINESLVKVDSKAIVGNVIEHYRRYANHQHSIVSCVSIDHAEHVATQFREAGYKAQAIHSRLSQDRTEALLQGLKNGSLELLMQCDMLGEGTDIKGASVSIDLQPTMSLTRYMQRVGRVLRYVPDKRAIVLDHVGNFERHGLPDDPRKWSLDGIDTNDKGILLYRRCESCLRPVKKTLAVCPYCGEEFAMNERERELPTEREGELVNVREAAGFELVSESFEDHKRRTIAAIAARARTLKEAIAIAREHGYENHRFGFYVWTKILKRRAA